MHFLIDKRACRLFLSWGLAPAPPTETARIKLFRNIRNMAESKPKTSVPGMTPQQFRLWRRTLGLKQKDAADRLGLKKRMIQYYEKGNRDGRPVEIPKSIRLACYALSEGIGDFDGQITTPLKAEAPDTD